MFRRMLKAAQTHTSLIQLRDGYCLNQSSVIVIQAIDRRSVTLPIGKLQREIASLPSHRFQLWKCEYDWVIFSYFWKVLFMVLRENRTLGYEGLWEM